VAIEVAQRVRGVRERALREKDERLINACDKALLGDELAIDECLEALAR